MTTEEDAARGRVVLAHGFTQTRRSWDTIGEQLEALGFDVVAVDLPGHGEAGSTSADLPTAGDLLAEAGGEAIYVGYSMGGRIALHTALQHPAVVRGLVLIGATAGIDDGDERRDRRASDDALATRLLDIGVEAFVEEWLRLPLFAGLSRETDQRADRLRNQAAGLADSLRRAGTGTQEPLWSRLGEIHVPTLVLVGARDEKFRRIGRRLSESIATSELVVVPEAGHTVHLERPDATLDAIVSWHNRHFPTS